MKDRELEKILNETDRNLSALHAKFVRALDANYEYIKDESRIFTQQEEKSWKESEPNFTKRIVTPLRKTKHQTRRYQNLIPA